MADGDATGERLLCETTHHRKARMKNHRTLTVHSIDRSIPLSREGFEYATYNDPEDLKRLVKRINGRGKIRSLFGRPRRAVAAIMMEALQVLLFLLDLYVE